MVGLARRVIGEAALRERLSFRLVWLICSARLRLSAASALHSLPPSGLEAALQYTVVLRPPAHVGTDTLLSRESRQVLARIPLAPYTRVRRRVSEKSLEGRRVHSVHSSIGRAPG